MEKICPDDRLRAGQGLLSTQKESSATALLSVSVRVKNWTDSISISTASNIRANLAGIPLLCPTPGAIKARTVPSAMIFMMREIEIAASIDLDIVQIDDGWQKGITANSKLVKGGVWEGYYANDPNFWDINEAKFPQGLAPIVDYAASKGITMGLWFSPDSSRDFANWKRDVETLRHLYEQYNIRYFKLDGVKLRNKTCERNYLRFLEELHAISHGQISFQSGYHR
ncbi:MAG: hypothetical protein ACLR23_12935 [Clostridia bacterium]